MILISSSLFLKKVVTNYVRCDVIQLSGRYSIVASCVTLDFVRNVSNTSSMSSTKLLRGRHST